MNVLLWMNIVLDFICTGFVEVWETGMGRKIENENQYIQRDSNLRFYGHVKISQCTRSLGYRTEMFNLKKKVSSCMVQINTCVTKHVSNSFLLGMYWN